MRVTNKVIQNNSVSNININKRYQDKLNNQMATEKKIVRPSDDPVVAIRALRLRTNVNQVTQYYSKNIPDAESWLDVTESALTTVSSVLTDMIEQCTKGSSEKLTSADRQTIMEALKALRDEVYSTGNSDYAGRSVFTGYRTDETLMYTEAADQKFSITEQINNDVLDTITYVRTEDINDINDGNYKGSATTEQEIVASDIHRLRLAYDNLDNKDDTTKPSLEYTARTVVDGKVTYPTTKIVPEIISNTETGDDNPYAKMAKLNKDNEAAVAAGGEATDAAIFIPETGEILMTDSLYNKLMALTDDITTPTVDESQLRVTYEKSVWKTGDLRPEHYFACSDISGATAINYNQSYLTGKVEKQAIEYDVGISQTIRVNTTADEVFTHAIGRDIDDLIASLDEYSRIEATAKRIESIRDSLDASSGDYQDNYKLLTTELDAANKALTYIKEKNQKLFEKNITNMQQHLDRTNKATTACGTRSKKLELIQNRLMSQKTNFETLESENENVDLTDVAIQLSGAELTYQAALMSTGKILQTSLMNYI